KEMYGTDHMRWLSNGMRAAIPDLGYFLGYRICKSYYNNASDKRQALKEIIELKYNNKRQVKRFLTKSNYNGDE
ncbi:MAG TPA: hypothetical protein VM012_08515, partial [Flavitalea sp.]|nr:hypothetical protein [Flavitalea sp.]